MEQYMYNYDDPYKILAHYIVGNYRPADVLRVLSENSYLKTCVMKEVRQMDMGGHYVDCIIQVILEDKKRMEFMRKLDNLGLYFYSKLDKERLRNEIRSVLSCAGIELFEDYSTEGNVLSAST